MKRQRLLIPLSLLSLAWSFQGGSLRPVRHRTSVVVLRVDKTHISFNPVEGSRSVDWKRAKHCAEHFGSCPVAEVEDIYQNVHKERLTHNLFGGVDLQHTTSDSLEHRIIEEELELQLNLLQEENKLAAQEVVLFPDEMISELPHLRAHAEAKTPVAERLLHGAEHQLIVQETSMSGDTLETLAMCAAVMVVIMLPQLIS